MKSVKNIFPAVFLFLLSSGAFGAIGFEKGNSFQAVRLRGEIHVVCNSVGGGSESAFFDCRDERLRPGETARFVGPTLDADEVVLRAIHEDGSVREKSASYDGKLGISGSRFNLWIATLTQRPLLNYGRNAVEYFLKKRGTVVITGKFEADVARGESLICRDRGTYFSSDPNDCRFADRFCDRYFYEQNYCQ